MLSKIIIIAFANFLFILWFTDNKQKIILILKSFLSEKIINHPTFNYFLECPLCKSIWFSLIFLILLHIPILKFIVYIFSASGLFLLIFRIFEFLVQLMLYFGLSIENIMKSSKKSKVKGFVKDIE